MALNNDDISLLRSYQYAKDLFELPNNIGFDGKSSSLDLTQSYIDMIPAGLKGVKYCHFYDRPKFVAPDFSGDIIIGRNPKITIATGTTEMEDLQKRYERCKEFVEAPRYRGINGQYHLCTLPNNMLFKEEKHYSALFYFLDLGKTSIKVTPKIKGVDKVFMPQVKFITPTFLTEKCVSHKSTRIVTPKTMVHE